MTGDLRPLFAGHGFEQGIEVFQAGIFDDHSSAAVLVFDRNLQAKGSLQRSRASRTLGSSGAFSFSSPFGFFSGFSNPCT